MARCERGVSLSDEVASSGWKDGSLASGSRESTAESVGPSTEQVVIREAIDLERGVCSHGLRVLLLATATTRCVNWQSLKIVIGVFTYCPKLTLIPRHGIMMATAPPQDPTPVGTFTLRKDATNITASPCPLGKGRKRGEGRSLSGSRSSTSHEPAFRVLLYR